MGLALRAPEAILHANADLIDRLRLHAATDEAQFQERFIGPLLRLAEFINVVPATATTLFSGEMGLFRASLEAGFFAFQASDGRIFTGAEGVERRHALEGRWRYLCFLAALFHPIGKPLERLTVTGPDGQTWKRHFSGITTWAEGAGATRLFVSWGGPDADDSIGPSSVTLQVLPAIVGAENLQMLQDGAAELVSDLYKLAIGEAGTSRIAQQVVTAQESGTRPARALPYELHVTGQLQAQGYALTFANTGTQGAHFWVYTGDPAAMPRRYTVEAGKQLTDTWALDASGNYLVSVWGPNGYFRRFAGSAAADAGAKPEITPCYDVANGDVYVTIANAGASALTVTATDVAYGGAPRTLTISAGQRVEAHWDLSCSSRWYDLQFAVAGNAGWVRRIAGHVETGKASITDPAAVAPTITAI